MTKNIAKLVSSASLALVLAGSLSGCATTASRDYNLENPRQKPRIENAEKYGAAINGGSFLYLLLNVL